MFTLGKHIKHSFLSGKLTFLSFTSYSHVNDTSLLHHSLIGILLHVHIKQHTCYTPTCSRELAPGISRGLQAELGILHLTLLSWLILASFTWMVWMKEAKNPVWLFLLAASPLTHSSRGSPFSTEESSRWRFCCWKQTTLYNLLCGGENIRHGIDG